MSVRDILINDKLTCAYPTMNAAKKDEQNSYYNILKTPGVGVG